MTLHSNQEFASPRTNINVGNGKGRVVEVRGGTLAWEGLAITYHNDGACSQLLQRPEMPTSSVKATCFVERPVVSSKPNTSF